MNAQPRHILGTGRDLVSWKPQVDRAAAAGGGVFTFDELATAIDDGRFFMFATDEAFVVVDPQEWASGLHLHVLAGGGTQAGLEQLEAAVRIWGQMIGAKKMVTLCRKGFARRVLKQGWRQPLVYLEKEISP